MHDGPSLWGHERVWLPAAGPRSRARDAHARRRRKASAPGAGDGRQLQADVRHVRVVGRGEQGRRPNHPLCRSSRTHAGTTEYAALPDSTPARSPRSGRSAVGFQPELPRTLCAHTAVRRHRILGGALCPIRQPPLPSTSPMAAPGEPQHAVDGTRTARASNSRRSRRKRMRWPVPFRSQPRMSVTRSSICTFDQMFSPGPPCAALTALSGEVGCSSGTCVLSGSTPGPRP